MERTTYEIMNPEDIGLAGSTLVLGKHSGRHAFADALATLGVPLEGEALEAAFARFKLLADRKVSLVDEDLIALATEASDDAASAEAWHLEQLTVTGGTTAEPYAVVVMTRGGEQREADAVGDGMIDAACMAIAKAVETDATLVSFQVAAVTPGSDAVGDVTVQVDVRGQRVNARGVSTDVVEASARAFVNAINKVVAGTAVPHRTDKP
jgi:2-isopropylmalate synthase